MSGNLCKEVIKSGRNESRDSLKQVWVGRLWHRGLGTRFQLGLTDVPCVLFH